MKIIVDLKYVSLGISLPRYFNFSFIICVTPSSMTRSNLNLEPHGVLTTRSEDEADEDRGCLDEIQLSPVGLRLVWVLVVQVTSDLWRLLRLSSCSPPASL